MATVTFAMEWLPSYRVAFYEGLRGRLAAHGVDVELLHGDPPGEKRARNDASTLPWATHVTSRTWDVGAVELTWQPVLRRVGRSDLIIVQQETALLVNYALMLRRALNGRSLAWWGHGENFNQLDADRIGEWLKRSTTRFADWAFAYTERSAARFRDHGMPADRITVVQNSVDLTERASTDDPPADEVTELLSTLTGRGAFVAGGVTAFDRWKRVPFLIDILDRCRWVIDDFEFIAVGGGDQRVLLEQAATDRPWLHVMGVRTGPDLAHLGRACQVMIQPGLVGLHAVDSFAFEAPLVTERAGYHSHEFDYLVDGVNSVVLPPAPTAEDYANAVTGLRSDPTALAELRAGCRRAAAQYSLERMIGNFADGVLAALQLPRND